MNDGRSSLRERLERQRGRIVSPGPKSLPKGASAPGLPVPSPGPDSVVPREPSPEPQPPRPAPVPGLPIPSPGPEGESREEKLARLRAAVARTEAGGKTVSRARRTALPGDGAPEPRPTSQRPLDPRSLKERMADYRRSRTEDDITAVAAAAEEGHERSDHDFPLSAPYGRTSLLRLPSIPTSLSARLDTDPAREGLDFSRALFVDTETSGLAGGTGTFAFLIGFGRVGGDSFRVTQFRLRSLPAEREMLEEVADFVGDRPQVVSYNGAGFDLPLLETRFRLHGVPNPFAESRHLDLLPLARRLFLPRHENAKLIHLEQAVLGVTRDDDIPSHQIPAIFFESLRNGVHPAMESVRSHHRYDILTLAALSLEAASRIEAGWDTEHGADLYGVGDHFRKREEHQPANRLFERALAAGLSGQHRDRCLLHLGEWRKREGDWNAALSLWKQVREADTREYLEALERFVEFEVSRREDFDRALAHIRDALDRLDRSLARVHAALDWGDDLPDQFFGRTPPRAKETILRLRDEWKARDARLPQQRDRCFLRRGEERKREGDWPAALALWEQVRVADTREYLAVLEWWAKYEEHCCGDFDRALAHARDARERLGRIPELSEEGRRRRRGEWEHRAARLEDRIARRTADPDGGSGPVGVRSEIADRGDDGDLVARIEHDVAEPEIVVHDDADGGGEGRAAPEEFVPDGAGDRGLFRLIPDSPSNPAPGRTPP